MTRRYQESRSHGGGRAAGRKPRDAGRSPSGGVDPVLTLQRNLGNQATQNLLSPSDLPKVAGARLEPAIRQELEPRLGYELDRVRIHDDEATHRTAESLNAQAFTVGDHIGFRRGSYSTATAQGRSVLAHELVHVKQAYEGRAKAPSRFPGADDPLEREARRAARPVLPPRRPAPRPLPAPVLSGDGPILAVSITLNTGGQVTDTSPGGGANRREDVLFLLDRMHTMWSITNASYRNQYRYVHARPRGSQVPLRDPSPPASAGVPAPWSFQPTIDAIVRTSHPSLAVPVIRRYMGIAVGGSVGRGSSNVREDVLAVMNRLNFLSPYATFGRERGVVTALAARSRVPDASLPGTFAAITRLKQGLAAGSVGIAPRHADELEYGGADRYAAQTSEVRGDAVTYTPAGARSPVTAVKQFSVFIPRGAAPGTNKVHLFFTPFYRPQEFVAQQGLRAQYDDTEWILIGVPALVEADRPNFITVSTSEIQRCLSAAGRGTRIDAIRMSAHSRGQRGLAHTLGVGARAPTIDLGLVEGVTIFDASYRVPGQTLRARRGALTRMQEPSDPRRFAPGAVNLYDVTVANVSGFPGTRIDAALVRGLAYVRLVEEGLARRDISRSTLSSLGAATRDATRRLLAAIPRRGLFSTRTPTPTGMTDLDAFLRSHRGDLRVVDNPRTGLKPFITAHGLDDGANYSRSIDAHHWFVAELAHEAVR